MAQDQDLARFMGDGMLREGLPFLRRIMTAAGLNAAHVKAVRDKAEELYIAEREEPDLKERLRAGKARGIPGARLQALAAEVASEEAAPPAVSPVLAGTAPPQEGVTPPARQPGG